jgi:hypothetical protein
MNPQSGAVRPIRHPKKRAGRETRIALVDEASGRAHRSGVGVRVGRTERCNPEGRARRAAAPGMQAGCRNGDTSRLHADLTRVVPGADQGSEACPTRTPGASHWLLMPCRPLANRASVTIPAALNRGHRSVVPAGISPDGGTVPNAEAVSSKPVELKKVNGPNESKHQFQKCKQAPFAGQGDAAGDPVKR